MKLCKDCKFIGYSALGTLNRCQRPIGTDLVTGDILCVDRYCSTERSTDWIESRLFRMCGKEGRYFKENKMEEYENTAKFAERYEWLRENYIYVKFIDSSRECTAVESYETCEEDATYLDTLIDLAIAEENSDV